MEFISPIGSRIVLWLLVVFTVIVSMTYTEGYVYRRYLTEGSANHVNVLWNYFTPREKFLVGFMRTLCSGSVFLAIMSPIWLEYPNFVGKPVVATVENNKLVYYPWGLTEFPWQAKREIVNVLGFYGYVSEEVLAIDAEDKIGHLNWYVRLRDVDHETFALKAGSRDPDFYQRTLIRYFLEKDKSLPALYYSEEAGQRAFCKYMDDRVSEDFGDKSIVVHSCGITFTEMRD